MKRRPNIVFLHNDHQAYYRHGWDEGVLPKRPHFDRFAGEGVVFTNTYTATPLCGPARRSLLTGLFPHTHGQHHNYTDPPYGHEVYLHKLTGAGYRNYYFGKWHAGPGNAGGHGCEGFSYTGYGNPYITPEYKEHMNRQGLPSAEHRIERVFRVEDFDRQEFFPGLQEGALYRCESPWCGEHAVGITETPKETHESFFLAQMACDALEELAEQENGGPFSLRVDFWGPHQPHFPTREFADLYDPKEIPVYGSFNDRLKGKPDMYHRERNAPIGKNDRLIIPNPLDWEEWQLVLARCYAHISMIDAAGGMILDRLDELGLSENTLVIWASDHGDAVASHGGHFDKASYMSEEMVRIPMALRLPGRIKEGQRRGELITNLDIPVTLLDAAGLSFSHEAHGRSLLELLEGDSQWREDVMFETYGHGYGEEIIGRGIVWRNYKYIVSEGQIPELYDLDKDPYEMKNLAFDPEYASLIDEMRDRLKKWQGQTDDPVRLIHQ